MTSPICRKVHQWHHCPELHKAIDGVKYIADHTKKEEDDTRVGKQLKCVQQELIILMSFGEDFPVDYFIMVLLGEGRLEIRGYGARQAFPMDFHVGSVSRHGWNYSTSANAL